MDVFCLEDFKTEFEKLNSKKAYKNLQDEIIKYFFNKPVDQLKSGTRLNNNNETPFIKKTTQWERWLSHILFATNKK